ncbi:ATPase GET3 [Aduncisulcus paluster]|uniref:ATPase GET3 n=1 Tax=Aduncisulcus paluster TaxID=2918883 RepID=A0ABQ5KR55_9EUKA|nr:ATPase GET3 [Aduncisulcus paluster]
MEYERSLKNIFQQKTLKWVFVGGKGGVGKTSCSSSIAVRLASVRSSVLLVSTDPAHNLCDAFKQKFGNDPILIKGFTNLFGMESSANEAYLSQLKGSTMKEDSDSPIGGAVAGALSFMIEQGAIPGLDELVSFGKLLEIAKDLETDCIVVDLPPTGHALRFLSLPDTCLQLMTFISSIKDKSSAFLTPLLSIIGKDVSIDSVFEKIEDFLVPVRNMVTEMKNPDICTFICVCIPEYLSVYETERLVQELLKRGIDTHNIILNQVLDVSPMSSCESCIARHRMQRKYIRRAEMLYGDDFHLTLMPLQKEEIRGVKLLKQFGDLLETKHIFSWEKTKEEEE